MKKSRSKPDKTLLQLWKKPLTSSTNEVGDAASNTPESSEGAQPTSLAPTSSNNQCSSSIVDTYCLPFSHTDAPRQPVIDFPPRNGRRFVKSWYSDFKWLEYKEDEDKAYCFPCRVFRTKTVPFNSNGYSTWKNATGETGGLQSHERDPRHTDAMKMWNDRDSRLRQQSTIIHSISNDSEHNQWLETVFLLIKALVKHGLPLRGHHEITDFVEGVSGGLFLNLLSDVVFKFRPDLLDVAKKLPLNAKYTSPEIQNEVISVLKELVERKISQQI